MSKEHPTIVTAYDCIAGFKSVLLVWSEKYELYEPWQTGDFVYNNPDDAERAAKNWAMADNIRFVPYKGKYAEGLFVCMKCMGLFDHHHDDSICPACYHSLQQQEDQESWCHDQNEYYGYGDGGFE